LSRQKTYSWPCTPHHFLFKNSENRQNHLRSLCTCAT
jgi:hypothetical protein